MQCTSEWQQQSKNYYELWIGRMVTGSVCTLCVNKYRDGIDRDAVSKMNELMGTWANVNAQRRTFCTSSRATTV
jgi:hypothetical protein